MRTLHMLHTLDVNFGEITSTVRNGFKWADLAQDEQIELCVCLNGGHEVKGLGVVKDLWFGRFKDIPARLIRNEHEVRSRSYDGLLDSMQYAYGDKFTEESPVTVVVYGRII